MTPIAWESYESRIRQRAQALASEAPFLFGHGQTYTVEETYPNAFRVRVGEESKIVLVSGDRLELPTARMVREWADSVLSGKDTQGRLRVLLSVPSVAALQTESDHVVREGAFRALTRSTDMMVPESVVRAFVRGPVLPMPPPQYSYIHEGLLTEDALRDCDAFLAPAVGALLSEAANLYNRSVRRSAFGPVPLRKSLAAQPAVLAEIVRTGRRFVASGPHSKHLAAYADSLRQQLRHHKVLFQAHDGEQR